MSWSDSITDSRISTNSRRRWRTEEPGVLQSMGLQRAKHDLATKQPQYSGSLVMK